MILRNEKLSAASTLVGLKLGLKARLPMGVNAPIGNNSRKKTVYVIILNKRVYATDTT